MRKVSKTKKRLSEIDEEIQLAEKEMRLNSVKSNYKRARSVTVGTAFCGVTELTLRGDGDDRLWCLLQPVEVIELIHQLAASNGCHILIKPRKDFASWRIWKEEDPSKQLFWTGHAEQANSIIPHQHIGTDFPPVQFKPEVTTKRSKQNVMATQKTVNGRNAKRTSKAT